MAWAARGPWAASAALGRCTALLGLPLAVQRCSAQAQESGQQPGQRSAGSVPSLCVRGGGSGRAVRCADGNEQDECTWSGGLPPAGRFRLVQYNVRGLTANDGTSAVDSIKSSLQAHQAAIICLNEVDLRRQPDGLNRLAEACGTPYVHFFGHVGGRYGNALLSRFPIRNVRDVHLDGGTELEWPQGSGQKRTIRRGLLSATLAVPTAKMQQKTPTVIAGVHSSETVASTMEGLWPSDEILLTVFCTHLDHMDEQQRVVQVAHALSEMKALGRPHVLVGDLNALDRNDYSPAEWNAIERKAAESSWSAPSDAACVRLLLREGYVDAFRHSLGVGFNGSLPQDTMKFTAHTSRPMYRIDYALVSPCALAAGLSVVGAFVDAAATGSDHFPLVVDMVWDSHRTAIRAANEEPRARL